MLGIDGTFTTLVVSLDRCVEKRKIEPRYSTCWRALARSKGEGGFPQLPSRPTSVQWRPCTHTALKVDRCPLMARERKSGRALLARCGWACETQISQAVTLWVVSCEEKRNNPTNRAAGAYFGPRNLLHLEWRRGLPHTSNINVTKPATRPSSSQAPIHTIQSNRCPPSHHRLD